MEDIARTRNERIDLSRIPFDDEATYDGDPGGRHDGRLPDREPRADGSRCAARAPRTLDDLTIQVAIVRPGRSSAAPSTPTSRAASSMREDPDYVVPYDHPSLEPVLQRHARHDHLPGPGDRGRDRVRRLLARRGGGPAPGDEPQALGGGDRGLPPALRRGRGARPTAPTSETAERVYEMIVGFSGFGFPKAHGAAFGLLAYQSTWLRVHYGPEFLRALLNEQPMGFYASDTLVHEAQRRGIPLHAADVNASAVDLHDRRRGRPHRARLRQRRARRRGRRARGRARGGRPVPLAGRPRLARRRRAARARPARVGGRVRLSSARTRPRHPPRGAVGARDRRARRAGARRARSSRCRSTSPPRPSCASSSRGSR